MSSYRSKSVNAGSVQLPENYSQLIANASTRLVKVSNEELDTEILRALQETLKPLGVDRGGLLRVMEGSPMVRGSHLWYDEGIAHVPSEINLAELFPWRFHEMVVLGKVLTMARLEDLPPEAEVDRKSYLMMGTKSAMGIPLFIGQRVHYLIVLQAQQVERDWPEKLVIFLRLLGEIFVSALQRRETETSLNKQLREILLLKERLEQENLYLQSDAKAREGRRGLINSGSLSNIMTQVEQVACTGSTVLIQGETGTGKELVAQHIHRLSERGKRPMIVVNCASLPAGLVESELFGREKGAFTGALTKQIGRFELANGSTLFLDEIGELPPEIQVKLLRVLQEGKFERLGSSHTIKVDVRIIAATNRNLLEEVEQGQFRHDLYYRLNVFPIHVPPLRERREDIPGLVWECVAEFGERMGRKIRRIAVRDMEALTAHPWPGNVRELRNIIEHAMITSKGDTLELHSRDLRPRGVTGSLTLEAVERDHIRTVLKVSNGRIKGSGGAAELLGLNPSTLYFRMRKLGIIPGRT